MGEVKPVSSSPGSNPFWVLTTSLLRQKAYLVSDRATL